jgi:small-conductance mechanosensitive channel
MIWSLLLYQNKLFFSEEAETPFLYMIMPLVGFVYVIFASIAVSAAFERYKQLMRSVVRNDLGLYLEHRDQQLPALMRILVAIPSLILLSLALMYQYADFWAGILSVFTVTIVISLTWTVITELDTTHKRLYFKATAPSHWHTQSTKDYFSQQQ